MPTTKPFPSLLLAVAIGLVALTLAGLFVLTQWSPDPYDARDYEKGIREVQANEEQALALFALLESGDPQAVSEFIYQTGLPAWQKNLKILDRLDQIQGLPEGLQEENRLLRSYYELRLESYEWMGKAIREDTDAYDDELDRLMNRIDVLLEKM